MATIVYKFSLFLFIILPNETKVQRPVHLPWQCRVFCGLSTEGRMDREEMKRLTKEEISRRIREGVKAVIELCWKWFIWGRGPKEQWGFRRNMDMTPLWAAEEKPTKITT